MTERILCDNVTIPVDCPFGLVEIVVHFYPKVGYSFLFNLPGPVKDGSYDLNMRSCLYFSRSSVAVALSLFSKAISALIPSSSTSGIDFDSVDYFMSYLLQLDGEYNG